MPVNVVPAERSLFWIRQGFALFRQNPWVWLAQAIVAMALLAALRFIPFIGAVIAAFLPYGFSAGMLWSCEQAHASQAVKVGHLFEGLRRKPVALVSLTIIASVGGLVAMAGTAALLFFSDWGRWLLAVATLSLHAHAGTTVLGLLAIGLIFTTIALPLIMALSFAPALIILDEQPFWAAMKQSFDAWLCNWVALPLYLFALLILALLATVPIGLGWLVFVPLSAAINYAAYRDMFKHSRAKALPATS